MEECLDANGRPLGPGRWCATHECWDCGNELLGEEWEAEGGWCPKDDTPKHKRNR